MIEILCSQLPANFCEIDQLAAILLRFCRDRAEQLRIAYDSDALCRIMYDESDTIQVWLERELEEDWLDDSDLVAVTELLTQCYHRAAIQAPDEADPTVAAVVAARAFAEALDSSHGRRFAGVFRGRGMTMLEAGDPIPVCRPPLKALFAGDLGTNPLRLGPSMHELVWLRILPDVARGHRVRLDFQHEHLLADLAPDARISVGIPCDLSDLERGRVETPNPRFMSIRPKHPDDVKRTILTLLDEANAQNARIFLMPELSLDDYCVAAIREWHARTDHRISILVCGSTHTERAGERRNVSTVILPDGSEIEHFKFNRFYMSVPSPSGGRPKQYREDIVTVPAIITINMCGDWSFSVLICKDILEPGVAEILEHALVSLVLVPALSPKTSVFEQIAGALTARAQAIVVVGNLAAPSPIDPASVIIARPVHTGTVETVRRSHITAPPYLHFSDFTPRSKLDS